MTTLLIDADILVFQVSFACQSTGVDWGNGVYSQPVADLTEAKGRFRDKVAALKQGCGADKVILALKGEGNFRRDVYPRYKANRSNLVPPMLREPLMQWLRSHPQVVSRPGLEGDDVIGILATLRHDGSPDPDKLIWSTDKDLLQVPGLHLSDGFSLIAVSEEEADHRFMMQTLTGDVTDNYPGCPGVGPVKAERWLATDPVPGLTPPTPPLQRAIWWRCVVKAFEEHGLTESDALTQARVARILRANDYDYFTKRPILWNPWTG